MPSLYDYHISQQIASRDEPFYALLFALIRKADTYNAERLKEAFPEVYNEFWTRYNARGGYLPNERSS